VLLRGVDDNGDPIDVCVDTCSSCGALIDLAVTDLDGHYESAHPVR
jgi:hypothetical protein